MRASACPFSPPPRQLVSAADAQHSLFGTLGLVLLTPYTQNHTRRAHTHALSACTYYRGAHTHTHTNHHHGAHTHMYTCRLYPFLACNSGAHGNESLLKVACTRLGVHIHTYIHGAPYSVCVDIIVDCCGVKIFFG